LIEHQDIGIIGEQYACTHLTSKGYTIREKNWRYGRLEVDIIAEKAGVVCFVEVKTRENRYAGDPALAVKRGKQKSIIKVAGAYIKEFDVEAEYRFDIIGIIMNQKETHLEHIEDAFQPLL
jgi:putative endonuclease